MTNQEFANKVYHYREQYRNLIEGDGGFQIRRGMAHTISGYLEDLFALHIAQKVNRKDILYLVDKVISAHLNGSSKATSFKPDLAIIENDTLTHYFDMKTNLGWNRYFEGYLNQRNEFVKQLIATKAWVRFDKNNVQGLAISKSLVYQMVVLDDGNINKEVLKNNLEFTKKYEHVKVHILCPWNDATRRHEVDEEAFKNIESTLPFIR